MDFERPHHHRTAANNNNSNSNSASSELFICFSSRLSSSSSMKLSSKSILSPGRTDKQISLSASLSRRLRSNGSIKGGQSPMFPTGTKKRGCAFENTEPTSPKVTCIGQVRVKTKKKQAMKMRSMSKRRGSSGEASFRRIGEGQEEKNQQQLQQHSVLMLQRQQSQNHHLQQEGGLPQRNNQKWVHLPLTICEALRAFGAEFNCFLPCRSSCMSSSSSSSDRESKEKMGGGTMDEREAAASARSCGAVFARWLVAMQEGEAEKGREIELVVGGGGGEEEEDTERRRSHHRRHVMEDIDINEVERCNNEEKFGVMEEEERSRVSICVPPKNALLLMRCRSDPVKMAALANRFWESPVTKDDEDDDRKEEEQKLEGKEIEEGGSVEGGLETEHNMEDEKFEDLVALHEEKEEASLVMNEEEEDDEEEFQEINLPPEEEHAEKPEEEEEEEEEWVEVMEGDELVSDSSIKALVDPENHEIEENKADLLQEEEGDDDENRGSLQSSCSVVSVQSEDGKTHEIEAESEDSVEEEEEKSKSEEETTVRLSEEETTVTMTSQTLEPETHEEDDLERESRHHHANLERESSVLPDCLLLMMCEPKLSMEVSKETWVCSTDFIRCIPSSEKKVNKTNGRDHPPKKKPTTTTTTDSNPPPHNILLQPPRSSISLPVAVASQKLSMATMIEQKLSSVAYEPFVLTRCKSEPMRTAAVKLKPEACFWNNRKLEPHHRGAAVGVGAAGVGF